MKKLIMISGTMGAGKTSVCIELQKFLPENVFLDGDWGWKAEPFVVNDETKEMVMKNIAFLLAQFLSCSAYQNVIFCWVMDHQEIIDELIARVEEQTEEPFEVHGFTLTLTPEALKERIGKDIESGLRKSDALRDGRNRKDRRQHDLGRESRRENFGGRLSGKSILLRNHKFSEGRMVLPCAGIENRI